MFPYGLFGWFATCWVECIASIPWKAAGEISSIVWVLSAGHGQFIAVVEDWRTAAGHHQGHRRLEPLDRGTFFMHETGHIVDTDKCCQTVCIGVDPVPGEHLMDLPQCLALGKCVSDRSEKPKVKKRIDLRIDLVVTPPATLVVGNQHWV